VLEQRKVDAWLKEVMPTLSNEQLDEIIRGGPGQLNLTALTDEQLFHLERGEPLETALPHWRSLVNPGRLGDPV
jgi:hypothetical protein